ncbi:MAG: hypothetical protein ABFD03_02980 [Clostridiaceae bacterium]
MEEPREDLALQTAQAQTEEKEVTFETIDYVRELFLNSEEQKKTDQKRVRLLRVCMILLSVIAFCIVAATAILVPTALITAKEVNASLAVVQKIDVEALVTTVNQFTEDAGETFTSVGSAVAVLEELDIVSLNATIAQLKTAVESFSQVDIAKHNEAIENHNDSVEPFASFFNKFN